ncbi:MAG: tryptophan 7-halogenase [Gammaproteobacteria bacterium]|nr:tryptophan 7-halogenase [Gammaproteobacteria bacterium]
MTSQAIQSIVIVGGGTAGWLTAGVLASRFKSLAENNGAVGIDVTLVESPDVQTIGVGEGTWPSMRTTLQSMGINETDFMRECNVSLKQGSRFDNWVTGESDYYYHPFSLPRGYGEFNLAPYWQLARDKISFADAVSIQSKLCDRGLAPKTIATPEFAFNANYGYHLDAAKFAAFLQQHCVEKLGVKHVLDHVTAVTAKDNGDIEAVQTRDSGAIGGDLFVDCTGFAALLIGDHYAVPFNTVQSVLFNDSALAVQVPYKDEQDPIASHTLSTAQSAGWVWSIGLPTRRGVGHVYSSAYIDDENAERELRNYLTPIVGRPEAEQLAVRKINMNPGYREHFWHRNCVAVGLSAGFVEPLEASALVLVEYSAKMIAQQLPANRAVMDLVAKRFNDKFAYHWNQIIDFLKLHYVLNQREDNGYWAANRNPDSVPDSLKEMLELWQFQSPWLQEAPRFDELFSSASFQFVLYGMGFVTQENPAGLRAEDETLAIANRLFSDNAKKTEQLLGALPTNRELVSKVAEHGFQKI